MAFAFPTPGTDNAKSEKSFNVTALFPARKDCGAAIRIWSFVSGSDPPRPTVSLANVTTLCKATTWFSERPGT